MHAHPTSLRRLPSALALVLAVALAGLTPACAGWSTWRTHAATHEECDTNGGPVGWNDACHECIDRGGEYQTGLSSPTTTAVRCKE